MRRDDQRQAVKNIPLEQLKPFKNHPFQVRDDEEFRRLVESIEIHGVIHPAVARQIGEDCYELISGHRRKAACEVLGYSEMPVLVRSMTDDEAVVNMVDANLQRETILPSERAFAYKMKLVAMSHQGRKGFTSAQLGRKCVGKESRELIAEQVGQSRNQISRYIRLTELIPEILEMVDNRKMALNPAVSISYLDKKQQRLLYKVMVALKATPSISQAKAIREKASESDFTEDYLVCILSEKKPNQREPMIVEEEEIKQYFPSHYNSPEFGSIRVIEENGKYLFCGADVAKSLGYKDTVNALKTHCREDGVAFYHLTDNLGRKQKAKFISEGNLYRLIVHSKLPSAERFEKWVFDEVLPTIRKHGSYLTKEKLWEVATSPEALLKLCSDLLAEREENVSLRIANAQLEGKAAFYDLFIDLEHSTNLRTTAKELAVPERRFVRFLLEKRFVYRTASGNVLPYAKPANEGLFCVKDYCNHGHTGSYTLITPQGKLYFAQLREMILLVS